MTASLTATEPIKKDGEVKLPPPPQRPVRLMWTVTMYHQAIEAGILTENDEVELIAGTVIKKMAQGDRHVECVNKLNVFFVLRYHETHIGSAQNALVLGEQSESEPDYVLVKKEGYLGGKPLAANCDLIIEVADSSLDLDRADKAYLYAQAGVQEYWIVNLRNDVLELYLQPNIKEGVYNSIQRYPATATFESPFCGTVTVADLLPE